MSTSVETKTGTGRVVRVIGPVVDAEIPRDAMPERYNALKVEVTLGDEAKTLTLEGAQHLGDNMVRAISMQPAAGLARGAPATDTRAASSVPVATAPQRHA